MNPNAVKWGQLQRFLYAKGFEIRPSGGDKIIIAPATHPIPDGGRNQMLIGHTSCNRPGFQVKPGYLRALVRNFGVRLEDIQNA